MRRTGIVLSIGLLLGVAAPWADGQQPTLTSSSPSMVGQSLSRASARAIIFNGTVTNPLRNITDGVAFTVNNTVAFGVPARTYEFDPAGNGVVTAGAIAVQPKLDDGTTLTADMLHAGRTLAKVINDDPTSPYWAVHYYSLFGGKDYGVTNGWLSLVWKNRAQYGETILKVAGTDPSTDITRVNFQTAAAGNPYAFGALLQVKGSNLSGTGITPKVRNVADNTKIYTGAIVNQATDGTSLVFNVRLATIASGLYPPTGLYDIVISRTGFTDVVLPAAFTLVENLLDDPSFRQGGTGNDVGLQWNTYDDILGPYWRRATIFEVLDGVRNTVAYMPANPRQYPFPTGTAGATGNNANTDNEHAAIAWTSNLGPNSDGVHRIWQNVVLSAPLATDTTLALTGLLAGGSGNHQAMSYGVQMRSGDENGAVVVETPAAQMTFASDWRDFTLTGRFPAGTSQLTVVFYGSSLSTDAKALHIDDLLLRVVDGAPVPPTVTAVAPAVVGNLAGVNLTVTGTGFAAGTPTVTVEGAGKVQTATNVAVLDDTSLTCTVDLSNLATSTFDVTVSVNGVSNTAPSAFIGASTVLRNGEFELPGGATDCTSNSATVTDWRSEGIPLSRNSTSWRPTCPCPQSAHGSYASMTQTGSVTLRAWQTVKGNALHKHVFSGFIAGGGTGVARIKMVDGPTPYGTELGSTIVNADGAQFDWKAVSLEANAVSSLVTVVWEMTDTAGANGIHADGLQFTGPACHEPWADVDQDGDVDMDDFAIMQICYTGPGPGNLPIPTNPAYCQCLDVEGATGPDGDIDLADIGKFELCAQGSGVLVGITCPE